MLNRYRILLLLFLCNEGQARSNGEIPNSACSNMLPGHGPAAQESASPFMVFADSSFFIRNLTMLVLAASNTSSIFKGFYCQARKVNNQNEVAGYFVNLEDNQRGHWCFSSSSVGGEFDTISHNSQWSSNPATELAFDWRSPEPNVNGVKFRCTFVLNYSTFWVGVESDTVTPIENESVSDCCEAEGLDHDGCQPLCRDLDERPADMTQARMILREAKDDSELCSFADVQRSLRCTYWSDTADNFDSVILEDCCSFENVSSDCMVLCSKNIIGTMDYSSNQLNNCLARNPGLASCLIFPAGYNSSNQPSPTQGAPTTSYPQATTNINEITSMAIITLSDSTPNLTTTTAVAPETTDEIVTTVPDTTTPDVVIATTLTSVPETTDEVVSTVPDTTTPDMMTATTTASVPETTDEIVTTVPDTTTMIVTTPTSLETFPQTTAPGIRPGELVFNITVTIDVDGATENSSLRQTVFETLRNDLLFPGLGAITGYTQVIVGVDYYEGSLVVVSEGLFQQQDDGSIPTITQILDSVNARLDNTGNQIRNAGQTWTVMTPIEVTRIAINGACGTATCGAQQTCVEVGPSGTVCLCLDQRNEEIECETDSSSGLSGGAIAGIVVGCLLGLVILALVIVFVLRCRTGKTNSSREGKRATIRSEGSYSYPDPPPKKEEPLYADISGESPPPPALPPSRIPTLPSHSLTYDSLTDGEKSPTRKVVEWQENEEGYMEPSLADDTSKPEKKKVSTDYTEPYAAYQASPGVSQASEEVGTAVSEPDKPISKESASSKTTAGKRASNEYIALDGYDFAGDKIPKSEEDKQDDSSKQEKMKGSTDYSEPFAVYQKSPDVTQADDEVENKVVESDEAISKESASPNTAADKSAGNDYFALDGYDFAGDKTPKSEEGGQGSIVVEN